MKKIEEVLEPIKGIDNITLRQCTDKQPLIYIPIDKSYIEILGHRIETGENFNSFGDFVDWLEYIKDVEEENKHLKIQMTEIVEYILTKYEEAKLDAQYIDGIRYPSIQERIYEDILERFELN